MRATVMPKAHEVRIENVPDAAIQQPTDAVIRVTRACICGSDLWPYNDGPNVEGQRMGHEAIGVVEDVGSEVQTIRRGQVVIMPFADSDGTCLFCEEGLQTACVHVDFFGNGKLDGAQAEAMRIPLADGTLYPLEVGEDDALMPSLLTLSDVMGTGHHAALTARVRPGGTVAVVGDGAVGLCAILAAKQLGADRIIAMSRHEKRQDLAREFGATDIVSARGDAGVAKIKDMTAGLGAHCVVEAVGTQESMMQAIRSTRAGGHVGFVGVTHGVAIPGQELFYAEVHLHGGPAPVRRFLPRLIDLVLEGTIDPGKVFDLTLPLEQVAEGYRAMDERRAIKALLQP